MTRADAARRVVAALAAVAAAATLAACAQIPYSGTPQAAPSAVSGAEPQDASVRVVAEGPRDGDSVYQIVAGFLAASGTAEEGYRNARAFLTEGRSARWYPGTRITIYDHNEARIGAKGDDVLEFTAPAVGIVDDQGVFSAAEPESTVSASFHLVKQSGTWRIDDLPPGLYMSLQDFQREYVPVSTYFYNRRPESPVLVPDPLFLPKREELPTLLVSNLFRGPSRWLLPAVSTGIPRTAALDGQVKVSSGVAAVPLRAGSLPAGGVERDNVLGQLVMTVTEAPGVSAVEVSMDGEPVILGGKEQSRLTREDVVRFLPADQKPLAPTAYYLRDGLAYALTSDSTPHRGPFDSDTKLAEIAVSPDAGNAIVAGISKDRKTLWTAPGNAPDAREERLKGDNLRSMTFDQEGRLWVLDGEGAEAVLLRLPVEGPAVAVTPRGFFSFQVNRIRVSSDGVRLAMLLETKWGPRVYLAAVTESASGVIVGSVRRLGYELRNPRDIAWGGPLRVVVLASEPNAQPQPYFVRVDNYGIDRGVSLADIESLTAAYGEPLLAGTSTGFVHRLLDGGSWEKIGPGTAPSYPG